MQSLYERKVVHFCDVYTLYTFQFLFTTQPTFYIVSCVTQVTDPMLGYNQKETEFLFSLSFKYALSDKSAILV